MYTKRDLFYFQIAFHLGFVALEEGSSLLDDHAEHLKSNAHETFNHYLLKKERISFVEFQKLDALAREGYLFCHPCKKHHKESSMNFSLSTSHHCPVCGKEMNYYEKLNPMEAPMQVFSIPDFNLPPEEWENPSSLELPSADGTTLTGLFSAITDSPPSGEEITPEGEDPFSVELLSVGDSTEIPSEGSTPDGSSEGGTGDLSSWKEGSTRVRRKAPSEFPVSPSPPFPNLGSLGQGSFGKIYRVRDPKTGRTRVLKVLPPSRLKKKETRERFLREIQITSMLEHPNVMPVYKSGYLEDGSLAFVLKELRGKTLEKYIKMRPGRRKKEKIRRQFLEIFLKICDGVDYAHDQGVIHRNLEPSNIVVGDYGEVTVMDWGIARWDREPVKEGERGEGEGLSQEEKSLTQHGSILGAPGYMAPEQIRGEEVDERVDVYSLGALLYEMLSGQTPFGGSSRNRLVAALMKDPGPLDKKFPRLKIPSDLSAIAMKALSRNREDRYQTVKELKGDILLYLEGHSVSAKRDYFWERARKWAFRNKAFILGVLLFTIFFLPSFLSMVWWKKSHEEKLCQELWGKARNLFGQKKLLSARDFQKIHPPEKADSSVEWEKNFSLWVQERDLLERVWRLNPSLEGLEAKLFEVEREIGLLSLQKGNLPLAHLSFQRCLSLGHAQEGEALTALWEKAVKEEREKALSSLKGVLERAKGKQISRRVLDQWLLELFQKWRPSCASLIIDYLDSPDQNQRILTLEAVSRLCRARTPWKKGDLGGALLEKLKKIDEKKNPQEASALIWALGRLKEKKAREVISQVRNRAGSKSDLWKKTIFPVNELGN